MNKKDLNPNIHLSEGNIKSRCTEDITFLTWSLRSRIHCPYATEGCKKRCFARKNETFQSVRLSRDKNFEESNKNTFVKDMINIIEYNLQRPKNKDKTIFFRIHTSGDFYACSYLSKWCEITDHFKGNSRILFQAYTKTMPILMEYLKDKSKTLEDINIHFVWSIWEDTPKEYTKLARMLGLQTFSAMPKNEALKEAGRGCFLCGGDCGNCRECYTGKANSIVIPYH